MENKNNLISNFINENIIEMPLKLRSKLYENESKYKNREEFEYIKRDIDDFIDNSTINRFLVLPGIRGVGKTTLLYQLYEYIYKDKKYPFNSNLIFFMWRTKWFNWV